MYRNNLVRTTLSAFVACTLLYTASASAQRINPNGIPPTTLLLENINDNLDTSLNGGAIKASWEGTEGATGYEAELYFSSPGRSAYALVERREIARTTMLSETFTGLRLQNLYTVRIVAKANGSEIPGSMTYNLIRIRLFRINPSSNSVKISWYNTGNALEELWLGTSVNEFTFEIREARGNPSPRVTVSSVGDTSYTRSGLREGIIYIVNIGLGSGAHHSTLNENFLEDGLSSVSGAFGSFQFRTLLEVLPEPESLQITTSIVDSNNLLVGWDNAAEGVTNYDLTLTTGEGTVIGTPKEVNALMAGSTTFISLDLGTAYTLSVVAKGDASVYSPSPPYRVIVYQPQLDTPAIFQVFPFEGGVSASGAGAQGVDRYIFKLYLGGDTSSTALDTKSIPNDLILIEVAFPGLEPLTQYTVEIIAQADNYRDSNPRGVSVRTDKANINAPTVSELVITPSTDNITVNFQNTQPGVNGYALSIHERFDDFEIVQSTRNFTISDSPVTFADLVPNGAYTLMALPTFNGDLYEYTGGIVSLDFVVSASLRLRLRAFLEGPLQ